MKTLTFFLLLFGVAFVAVVTCAPSFRPKVLPLHIAMCANQQLCPDDYKPICAVDAMGISKTFANRCFVDYAYCRERKYYVPMKEGEC